MPIKFRCPHCRQFLGISRSKAGEIADCPMCGKRLRVPNLDGSVDPLPTPELDLQDSSLVDALGELAGIGSEARTDGIADSDEAPIPDRSAPPPAPRPEPVVLDPLVPADPVAVAEPRRRVKKRRSPQETTKSVDEDEQTIDDPELPIPDVGSREAFHSERVQSRSRWAAQPWVSVAVLFVVCLLGGAGLVAMMSGGTKPDDASRKDAGEDGQANRDSQPTANASEEPTPAVKGRITYVSDAGDTRPDDGAKVMAFPDVRRGTVMLDTAGLLVGSEEVDLQVATAALRALGGDVATADDRGEYELQLPSAGKYHVLVISRHQSRPWEVGVESDVQDLLARFLIRPSTLLGQLAYDVQGIQYRGHGTSPRDFAFHRE